MFAIWPEISQTDNICYLVTSVCMRSHSTIKDPSVCVAGQISMLFKCVYVKRIVPEKVKYLCGCTLLAGLW